MLTVQVPVPVHAPLQPAKVEPPVGVATRVTGAPLGKLLLHVEPQLMPAGELVTVPVPLPVLATFRTKFPGTEQFPPTVPVPSMRNVSVAAQPAFILKEVGVALPSVTVGMDTAPE